MQKRLLLKLSEERAPDQRKRAQAGDRPHSSVPRRPTVRMLNANTRALIGWLSWPLLGIFAFGAGWLLGNLFKLLMW